MKIRPLILLSLLAAAGVVAAQDAPLRGIAESTDPDKIANIEQHAQILAQQSEANQNAGQRMRDRHRQLRRGKPSNSTPANAPTRSNDG